MELSPVFVARVCVRVRLLMRLSVPCVEESFEVGRFLDMGRKSARPLLGACGSSCYNMQRALCFGEAR